MEIMEVQHWESGWDIGDSESRSWGYRGYGLRRIMVMVWGICEYKSDSGWRVD